ncbi:putative corepressor interacting with RBPJ 1 [Helianthus anomalus]
MEMMKAVSFMYVCSPGYNAESAKAADTAEEKKPSAGTSDMLQNPIPPNERTKKPRPKDVFGILCRRRARASFLFR